MSNYGNLEKVADLPEFSLKIKQGGLIKEEEEVPHNIPK